MGFMLSISVHQYISTSVHQYISISVHHYINIWLMSSRRKFIKKVVISSVAGAIGIPEVSAERPLTMKTGSPLVVSTWDFGLQANEAAIKVLTAGGYALDAVEAGVKVAEDDPDNSSVGYGGLPDRDGFVTLDACVMNEKGRAGSVCCLQHIRNPVTVARMVMERTPHVILVGEGALDFALSQGMKKENLLTEKSRLAWEKWKEQSKYEPIINIENHDTIGMLAIDQQGRLSGACTTSGLAFKMHGRVGDSPIIGAGLFVDNEVGAATCTGLGEAMLRTLGSFLVVEKMRMGASPEKACREAVLRIAEKHADFKDFQVGFLAITKNGKVGAYSLQPGFTYALYKDGVNRIYSAPSIL
jgi:N4-(beta-N-acetylglucosaminyl)-L-asparaginase